jgi:hypothetical protein
VLDNIIKEINRALSEGAEQVIFFALDKKLLVHQTLEIRDNGVETIYPERLSFVPVQLSSLVMSKNNCWKTSCVVDNCRTV